MKTLIVITSAVGLGAVGWFLKGPHDPQADQAHQTDLPPPTSTNTDPKEVFQRAFWKRPTPDDEILHAERREWADSDGVSKWQWFLAVKPSAQLTEQLKASFNLRPVATPHKPVSAPSWFNATGEVLQAPHGNLQIVINPSDHTLYATDTGDGFKPGAAEPSKATPQVSTSGRLPTTLPPRP